MDLTPQDLDMLTRTIIGEAGNQPPIGQAAVGHTILNRLNSGKWGGNVPSVVLAPSQFEAWSARPQELATIPRNSKQYQDALAIAKQVASGDIPDPTNGAQNFANVDIVKQRGNQSAMKWINGMSNVTRIGDHTFGNANAYSQERQPQDPIAPYIKTAQTVPQKFDFNSVIDAYGAHGVPAKNTFDAAGVIDSYAKPDTAKEQSNSDKIQALNARNAVPVPPPLMSDDEYIAYKRNVDATAAENNKSAIQKFDEAIDPTKVIPAAASAMWEGGKNAAVSGWDAFKKGLENPNILPSFEKTQSKVTNLAGNEIPATGVKMTDPGKALGAVGGLIGMGMSPVSSVLNPAKEQLEKITGDKEFAEKAAMLVPVGPLGKAANEIRPTVKATRSIADIVPDHYLPEALSASERNPSLSLVDISQSARNRADMIARDALAPKAQQEVMDFVDKRKGQLSGDLRDTLEVLGEIPDPYSVVTKIQQRAKDTGEKVINPIVKNSKPAEITGIVNDIDAELAKATKSGLPLTDYQRRLSDLRDELRGIRNDRDQMFSDVKGEQGLHKTQWQLRAEADNLLSSASGAERTLGGKLMPWRQRVVDAIDTANPGYKEGLSKYRTDKEVAESFDRGLSINKKPVATSESILENSPGALKDWVNNPKTHPDAIATAKIGALSWMAQELEGMRSGKKLMDSPKDKVLQGKLEALFGEDTAKEYIDLMRDTHRKAQTASELGSKGSQTFARGREAEASPVRLPGANNSTPGTLQALALGGAGALADTVPLLSGFHGWPTALGLGAAAARAGYGGVKSGYEHLRYKSDLARRMAEAKALTVPLGQQPDLLQLLRDRNASIGGGNKLLNLAPSPILEALPR